MTKVTGVMRKKRVTRGNHRKLVQLSGTSTSKKFFTVRAAVDCDNLPDEVMSAETFDVSKAKLDKTWNNLKYELTMKREPK